MKQIKLYDLLSIVVIIALSISAFWRPFGETEKPIDAKKYSLLGKVDSLSVRSLNPSAQRLLLITVLQERLAIDGNSISTAEDIRMQTRLFYVAILAGLASLLFRKDKSQQKVVAITLLFIIMPMYLLEIHRDDLYKRQIAVYTTKGIAVDSLVNLTPDDTTWYVLTNENINEAYKNAQNTRVNRKIWAAFQPDPEQLLFYLVPICAIYWFTLRSKKRNTAT